MYKEEAMSAKVNKEPARNEPRELTVTGQTRNLAPFEEMERWFEEAFRRPFFGQSWMPRLKFSDMAGEITPAVDIFEDGSQVVVKAEIPGMMKEDIEVNLSQDTVTISGHKKEEEQVEKKDFYRLERSYGAFTRKLRLPAEVQPDKAKATFKNGVLEVRIPKSPTATVQKVSID